jgi:hypothetical protein
MSENDQKDLSRSQFMPKNNSLKLMRVEVSKGVDSLHFHRVPLKAVDYVLKMTDRLFEDAPGWVRFAAYDCMGWMWYQNKPRLESHDGDLLWMWDDGLAMFAEVEGLDNFRPDVATSLTKGSPDDVIMMDCPYCRGSGHVEGLLCYFCRWRSL